MLTRPAWARGCFNLRNLLDALREGYEVYVVADAIGGVSTTAHESAMHA